MGYRRSSLSATALCCLTAALATTAGAPPASPLGFEGLRLGMSLQEARQAVPQALACTTLAPGIERCESTPTGHEQLVLAALDGAVVLVRRNGVRYPAADSLSRRLLAEHGAPTATEPTPFERTTSAYREATIAKHADAKRLTWRDGNVELAFVPRAFEQGRHANTASVLLVDRARFAGEWQQRLQRAVRTTD